MRKLSGRRGKRNLKLRKGLRRRERSGVIVAERIKVETGVLLVGWRSWWGQKKGEREEVLAGEMGEESGGPMGTRGKGGYDRRRDDDGPPARFGSPPPPRRGRCTQRWGWWSLEKEKCFPKRLSSKTRITTKIDDDGPSRRDFGERDGGGCWRSGPPRDEPSRGGDRYCGAPKGGGRDFSERRGSPPREMGSPRRGSSPRRDFGRDDDCRGGPPHRASPEGF